MRVILEVVLWFHHYHSSAIRDGDKGDEGGGIPPCSWFSFEHKSWQLLIYVILASSAPLILYSWLRPYRRSKFHQSDPRRPRQSGIVMPTPYYAKQITLHAEYGSSDFDRKLLGEDKQDLRWWRSSRLKYPSQVIVAIVVAGRNSSNFTANRDVEHV
jgi:hypothetical protein